MNPILFTAAKGAERVMYAQHVRANNLANANTVGFKSLIESAKAIELEGAGFKTSVTARTNSSVNNFKEGDKIRTDRPLDLTIDGTGFFAVKDMEGKEMYTRNGSFHLTNDGNLMLNDMQVLSTGNDTIQLPDFEQVNINENGLISVSTLGGATVEVANLKLINPNYKEMTMNEVGLFNHQDGFQEHDENVLVRSGFLESSNVSSLEEMISIMSLTRQYEMQVEVMAAAKEINQLGNQLLKS